MCYRLKFELREDLGKIERVSLGQIASLMFRFIIGTTWRCVLNACTSIVLQFIASVGTFTFNCIECKICA